MWIVDRHGPLLASLRRSISDIKAVVSDGLAGGRAFMKCGCRQNLT
jgi:hypothetical protein